MREYDAEPASDGGVCLSRRMAYGLVLAGRVAVECGDFVGNEMTLPKPYKEEGAVGVVT